MTSYGQLERARRLVEMWAADNRIDDLAVEWAWSDDTIASASECFRVAASLALDGMPAKWPRGTVFVNAVKPASAQPRRLTYGRRTPVAR